MKINKSKFESIIKDEINKLLSENRLLDIDESALSHLVKMKSIAIKETDAFFYIKDRINSIFKDSELSGILDSATNRIEELIRQEKFGEEK